MISSIGVRTISLTTNVGIVQWRNGPSGRVRTMEVSVINTAATVQRFGLGVPAALASNPVDVTFPRDDLADPPSRMICSVDWIAGPTAPAAYKRICNVANLVGVGIIWVIPRGYPMGVSSAHVIHGISTMVANDVNIVVDE